MKKLNRRQLRTLILRESAELEQLKTDLAANQLKNANMDQLKDMAIAKIEKAKSLDDLKRELEKMLAAL